MKKIIMVEDDININEMVADYLKGEGFLVCSVYTGKEAVELLKRETFDLALVDLMLPEYSGFDVIKHIRLLSTMPIIIVTAKDNDMDKTMGLNLGADDYVTKPFSIIELVARIRANIRRATQYTNPKEEQIIEIRDLKIYIEQHKVICNGKSIDLTQKEFSILSLLASHPGCIFSKEQMYNKIWNEPYYGNERVLNSHMNRLRNKLKKVSNDEVEYIKTLWGIGYKMENKE